MNNDKIQAYKDKLKAEAEKQEHKQELEQTINATKDSANSIIKAVAGEAQRTRQATQKVKSVDPLASPEDIKKVADGLDELLVSQTITADDLTEKFKDISAGLLVLADEISSLPKDKIEFPDFPEQKEEMKVTNFAELNTYFNDVVKAVENLKQDIKFDPTIQVAPADVKVEATDMKPVINGLAKLEKAIAKIQIPEYDNSLLLDATQNVTNAINGLEFPMPNYVLPYISAGGASSQVVLDSDGNIPTSNGKVSTLNSTTTLLTAGTTFTGEWEDVTNYASVVLAVKTDQNGTFTIQFSPDGTNADSTLTRYYRTNQIEAPHNFTVTRKYFRVTFTNTSASDQTYLRFQTMIGDHPELNAPLDSTLAQDFDAVAVRPTDYKYEVALGRRQGATLWNKFGYNDDVDTATPEVVAAFGGTFTPLYTASTLRFVSTSTDDDGSPAGIGANALVVYGVDANYDQQIEVVTLNGTTNVDTTSTWLGVNRISIYLAGSSRTNVGAITVTAITGGATQATMPIGSGTSQQCMFFVKNNHQALMEYARFGATKFSAGTNPIITFKGWVYSAVSNAKYEVFRITVDTDLENFIDLSPGLPFIIGEKSAFWIEATTTQDNTSVTGRFSLIEVRDVDA